MGIVSSPSRPRPADGSAADLSSSSHRANLAPTGEMGSTSAPDYFQAALPIIEDVLAFHSFRGRLSPEEREDFRSWVMCELIENDYARLRKFEGRSSLRSFVSVVVGNLLLDYWQRKHGRRRPSSAAKLCAPEGVWLERYLRDGYSVSEAIRMVESNHASPLSEDELYHITIRLPVRRGRPKEVPDSLGEQIPSTDSQPDKLLEAELEDERRARVESALERALDQLSPDERVFVRMRFEDGSRINEIAKAFHLPEKAFYRRFQRTLRQLRRGLESHGLDANCLRLYGEGESRENFRARVV